MNMIVGRGRVGQQQKWIALVALMLGIVGCGGLPREGSSAVDLSPFRDLARSSDCTDIKNRLFLIDGTLVLWDRQGQCPDASYLVRLSNGTTENVLCELRDSIAGPVKECLDEEYAAIFETITANLDAPDLGLGTAHTITPVTL